MPAVTLCAICHKRKGKRDCPGVRGTICTICCGTEREVSVDCPLDCPYLREARRYEAERSVPPPQIPFPDVEVGDGFLAENEQFIGQMGYRLLRYAVENPRTTDNDLQAALEKMIRTYETLASGIYYESLPEEASQIGVFRDVKSFLEEYQKKEQRRGSVVLLKESDVIRALVFLSRLAAVRSNRRPRGRAFIDFLRQSYPEAASLKEESRLILPGR